MQEDEVKVSRRFRRVRKDEREVGQAFYAVESLFDSSLMLHDASGSIICAHLVLSAAWGHYISYEKIASCCVGKLVAVLRQQIYSIRCHLAALRQHSADSQYIIWQKMALKFG